LASVVVGFGYFAVLGCKDLWNNGNHLAKGYGYVMRCLELRSLCVSLKITAHLRTFVSQSDSSIQQPRSIHFVNVNDHIMQKYNHVKHYWLIMYALMICINYMMCNALMIWYIMIYNPIVFVMGLNICGFVKLLKRCSVLSAFSFLVPGIPLCLFWKTTGCSFTLCWVQNRQTGLFHSTDTSPYQTHTHTHTQTQTQTNRDTHNERETYAATYTERHTYTQR